jgi:hypothetical protein
MRTTTALVLLALALAAGGEPFRRLQGVEAAPPSGAAPLVGAWNGQWTTPTGVGTQGAVELVLARVPGRDAVLGHFTFMAGGTPRTFRYEGRLDDGVLRFPLVGEGRILLAPRAAARPGTADVLQGEWVDAAGVLPAPSGTLQLSRVPLH